MYLSAFIATSSWSDPAAIAEELRQCRGVPFPGGGVRALAVGWIDLDTYVEVNELYSQWLSDAANILLDNRDWDLFYMHSHPTDWVYHAIISDMDPNTQPDEQIRRKAWKAHLGVYQSQDRMLAAILESLDKDTLVILISDHGATPDGPKINPYDILVPAGLILLFWWVVSGFSLETVAADDTAASASDTPSRFLKALEYTQAHGGLSLLIMRDGKIIFEDYHNGHTSVGDNPGYVIGVR